jgi:hypothetical protein
MRTWQDGTRDHAQHGGHQSDSCTGLARALMAAGTPDSAWRSMTASGVPSLFGPSLHRLARLVASESDKGGLRWVKWRPFPGRAATHDLSGAVDAPEAVSLLAGAALPAALPQAVKGAGA